MYFDNEQKKEQETLRLSLSNRQASLLIAAAFLILFFSFITGYFWGKRNAVSQFCMSVEQASFADRIFTSMCELSDTEAQPAQETVAANQDQPAEVATGADAELEDEQEVAIEPEPQGPAHHAQLAGYGSQKQAEKFVEKLGKKGIQAKVETRKSKSTKGKTRSWYQVVTKDYTDKNELELLVARISKEEKLSGVRIIRS